MRKPHREAEHPSECTRGFRRDLGTNNMDVNEHKRRSFKNFIANSTLPTNVSGNVKCKHPLHIYIWNSTGLTPLRIYEDNRILEATNAIQADEIKLVRSNTITVFLLLYFPKIFSCKAQKPQGNQNPFKTLPHLL